MQALEELQTRAQQELAAAETVEATEAWFRAYLGRAGALTTFLRGLSDLPRAERPAAGRAGNQLKKRLEEALHTRQEAIRHQEMARALAAEGIDVTMPGRRPTLGKIHPSNQTLREIAQIFGQMGFQVYDSPEVETDDLQLRPPQHPARPSRPRHVGHLLHHHARRHPAHAHQPRPDPRHARILSRAIRVILPGKCYRHEDVSARYDMMFHQVEGSSSAATSPSATSRARS